ncbi:MmcB family DNA repair protein [Metabacillus fastidiosus]|uniref:MmcB family DNA repair protein n=1 Tax=Metabacillus fastidiosus TaxID=1458 RepID=UPI003D2D254F
MKATITGLDALSKRILLDLDRGLKVSEVPEHYPVSLDQAKRLSRFRNMLNMAEENLDKKVFKKLESLGLKSLPLSSLFRKLDWEGIVDILAVVTDETKREELEFLLDGLEERRKRLKEFKEEADLDLKRLEFKDRSLQTRERELLRLQEEINRRSVALIDKKFTVHKVKEELKEIREERTDIQRKMESMKKRMIHSYKEIVESPVFLSDLDLKRQKELQDKALKWLFQRGFVAVADFTLPNGKRADIFAYNESQIVILEVKVSHSDLMTDLKWTEYLPYCDDFYFFTPAELVDPVSVKVKEVNCGQCVETEDGLKIIKADERVNEVAGADELKFEAGQLLSRKFIYGY